LKITITNPQIAKAINLISSKSQNEKRIFSPDPKNEPYWHHMVRVYYWLVQKGETDLNLLLAAILHDSVEDNYVTLTKITELFGTEVAEIVNLLSEKIHTDHTNSKDRSYYYQEIQIYADKNIRTKAIKIKVADRYDNLIGLSFTNLENKKEQYRNEIEMFFYKFAQEVGMEDYISKGLAILNKELIAPDILLQINFEVN